MYLNTLFTLNTKVMARQYILLLILAAFSACKKEDLGERFFGSECMNGYRMPFSNTSLVTNYVKAETSHFGPLQLVSGHSGDSIDISVWQTIATTDPSLVLNGNYPLSKLVLMIGPDFGIAPQNHMGQIRFNIEKLSKKTYNSLESQIDSSFQLGDLTLSKSPLSPDTSKAVDDNFAFVMWVGNCESKGAWDTGRSALPDQNGTLHCDQFNKILEPDSIRYQINLSFDNITLLARAKFEMNDGKMVLDFKIPR
jgi:hypothetical protein